MRRFLLRLLRFVSRAGADAELSREIEAHLLLLEDELRRRGLGSEEARRAARVALGGVEQTKERQRDARSFVWLEDARRDLWHAARLLRRSPGFALTAVLSLAVGIGANAAVFTVANALLFRAPSGVADPDRLVDIGVARGDGGLNPASYPTYRELSRRATTLAGVYAADLLPQAMSLEVGAQPGRGERVFGLFVSTSYFAVLGSRPLRGRLFDAADRDEPGASPVVVLSQRLWARRFAANPAVLGRSVRLNGQPFTVVGVAAAGFQGTGVLAPDVWLPLGMIAAADAGESVLTNPRAGWLAIGGRLKPGVPLARAALEIDAIGRALDDQRPAGSESRPLRLLRSSCVPGNEGVLAAFMAILLALVSLVLAVACANLSGILLARSAARRREMAVRLALGVGRARLVRQLLTETLLLFVLGGAAGLLLARAATALLVPLLPPLPFPISVTLPLDGRVIAFTSAASLVAALLCGLAPALQASKAEVVTALAADSYAPAGRSRLRSAFVVAQVALSLVLVVVAATFVRALRHAGVAEPGFEPRGVELATVDLSMAGYTQAQGRRFWAELEDRVRRLPGVRAATIARVLPGGFEGIGMGGVAVPGDGLTGQRRSFSPSWNIVEPGYFATLRIPLLAGRDFDTRDRAGAEAVAIVGERLARQLWPGQDAVGRLIAWQAGSNSTTLRVVGVAADVKSTSLVDGMAESFVYLPLQQNDSAPLTSTMTLAARAGERRIAAELRDVVRSLDPRLAIVASGTLEDSVALGLVPQRVAAAVAGSLGSVGLLLAAIGIYGVTSYTVARRTREIGIRVALGARPFEVLRMVLRQGLLLTTLGAAIGLALAAAVSRVLVGFLFGLPPVDASSFGAAATLFVCVGALACAAPAWRAAAVEPMAALRHE
jgi:predicted permease